jgi:hypothetical protein
VFIWIIAEGNRSESRVIHEGRALNVEAHNFARSALALQTGRHLWLGQTPDPLFVPLNIELCYGDWVVLQSTTWYYRCDYFCPSDEPN